MAQVDVYALQRRRNELRMEISGLEQKISTLTFTIANIPESPDTHKQTVYNQDKFRKDRIHQEIYTTKRELNRVKQELQQLN